MSEEQKNRLQTFEFYKEGKIVTSDKSIKSKEDIMIAFYSGLIPCACENNPARLSDYVLFGSQIAVILRRADWKFTHEYIELVRKSRQSGSELARSTHTLAAYNV